MEYAVKRDGEVVGTADVRKKGLYYEISCRCQKGPYTVEVHSGDKAADLGLCVPRDGGFGFHTQIPIKKIGEGELEFCAASKGKQQRLIPVEADAPFPRLQEIKNARFCKRENQVGVIIIPRSSDR